MRKNQIIIILLVGFLCIPAQGQETSKWKIIGPFGGPIEALAVNPQNLNECYAIGNSTGGDIYRSVNGGKDWVSLHEFSGNIYDVVVDPIDPSVLYVLGNGYVCKSMDKGKTWNEIPFGTNVLTANGNLAINPRYPSTLYAIGRDASDYQKACSLISTDGAETWARHVFFTAPYPLEGYSLAISFSNPNVLYSTIRWWHDYSYEAGCVFKSTDGGQSWTKSSDTLNYRISSIAIDPFNPNKVYFGTNFTVFRSSDGGQTWHQSVGYVYSNALLIDPVQPNTLYSGYDNCSYISEDGGIEWTRYPCSNLGSCRDLLPLRNHILFASDSGIYRTSDKGEHWENSHKGISKICLKTVSITKTYPTAIFALPFGGERLYKSEDFGITWQCSEGLETCGSVSWVEVHPKNPENVFISTLGGG